MICSNIQSKLHQYLDFSIGFGDFQLIGTVFRHYFKYDCFQWAFRWGTPCTEFWLESNSHPHKPIWPSMSNLEPVSTWSHSHWVPLCAPCKRGDPKGSPFAPAASLPLSWTPPGSQQELDWIQVHLFCGAPEDPITNTFIIFAWQLAKIKVSKVSLTSLWLAGT